MSKKTKPRSTKAKAAKGKAKRERRRVCNRGLTDKQKRAMDLKKDGFTHGQIAKQMSLRNESSVVALLKRGEANERLIEAEVRRERASGRSIRSTMSLDSLEGGNEAG